MLDKYQQRFEEIMAMKKVSDEKRDLKLSLIMTEMEKEFGIPLDRNDQFDDENPEVIALYTVISSSRVTI
jgi:hypothetical protein